MTSTKTPQAAPRREETAPYLDRPPERRAMAKAHAAALSVPAGRIALGLPISADVDDFRRVLAERAKP